MAFTHSLDCVNFELGPTSISLVELIEDLVYESSGNYALTIKETDTESYLFILDSENKTLHQYKNKKTDVEEKLKVDLFYWYNEVCIVAIHADPRARKLLQTTVFLDHSTKTFQINKPRSYPFWQSEYPSGNFGSYHQRKGEAKTMELQGESFVIWMSVDHVNAFDYATYAIPYEPKSTSKAKRFALPLLHRNYCDNSQIAKAIGTTNDVHIDCRFLTDMSVIGNIAYFPSTIIYNHGWGNPLNLLGVYMAIDFGKVTDVYDMEDEQEVFRLINIQKSLWSIFDCIPQDKTSIRKEIFCPKWAVSKQIGSHFATVVKEKTTDDKFLTKIMFTNFSSKNMSTVYNSVESNSGDVAVSVTPFNVIIATMSSSKKINYSVSTLPIGNKNKMLSLRDVATRYTYLSK